MARYPKGYKAPKKTEAAGGLEPAPPATATEAPARAKPKAASSIRRFVATDNPLSQKDYPAGTVYTTADIIKRGHHPLALIARRIIRQEGA